MYNKYVIFESYDRIYVSTTNERERLKLKIIFSHYCSSEILGSYQH